MTCRNSEFLLNLKNLLDLFFGRMFFWWVKHEICKESIGNRYDEDSNIQHHVSNGSSDTEPNGVWHDKTSSPACRRTEIGTVHSTDDICILWDEFHAFFHTPHATFETAHKGFCEFILMLFEFLIQIIDNCTKSLN